jgi:hypothetical protein
LSKLNFVLGALSPNDLITTHPIDPEGLIWGVELIAAVFAVVPTLLRPGFSS